ADDLVGGLDGDADEGGLDGGVGIDHAGAVEEVGFVGDVGEDGGLPGFDDAAGDAFAHVVTAAGFFFVAEADGGGDAEVLGSFIAEDECRAADTEAIAEDLHDLAEELFEVEAAAEDLANTL
ncbi:MAG: hypothetical protein MI923_10755, partial [Phycisphaerales bacterium]|nr:hypothetical protein [Phycisphaerales bacterium]